MAYIETPDEKTVITANDENHRWNRPHPVKMRGGNPVLGAAGAHADDFLGSEVGGEKS